MSEILATESATSKRITELQALNKLTGREEILVDNGDTTLRVTVDSLLGYIANQINAGDYPEQMTNASAVVVIDEGEELPAISRIDGNVYYRVVSTKEAKLNAGLTSRIKVSPNMGLKIIAD